MVNGKIVEKKEFIFQELVKPYQKRIPSNVEKLTGIRNEMVEHSRQMWEVFADFMSFVKGDILVGFNSNHFDKNFLMRAGRYSHIMIENEFFDVMIYANEFKERLAPEIRRFSLGKISEILNITNTNAHRALADAITTAKVYLKLLEMEETKKGKAKLLETKKITQQSEKQTNKTRKNRRRR